MYTNSSDTGTGDQARILFGDFNGDGLTDVYYASSQASVNLSRGDGTFTRRNSPTGIYLHNRLPYLDLSRLHVVDSNGDGYSDIHWLNNTAHIIYINQNKPALITKITNGLGVNIQATYRSLINNPSYTQQTDAVFPMRDLSIPLQVVTQTKTDNGIGGLTTLNHGYRGAKYNTNGRGFSGFRERTTEDPVTQTNVLTRYNTHFPYTGVVEMEETHIGTRLISRLTNSVTNQPTANARTRFVSINQSIEQNFNVDNGALLSTVTSANQYDDYGNPTRITVTTEDAASNTYITTTENSYNNNLANWHLGRLTRAQVTQQQNGVAAPTRTSTFTYNSTTGLLQSETIEPGTNFWLTKQYQHDTYGNRTSVTTTGYGVAARTSNTHYDSRGVHPISSSNALGHTETYEHNDPWGNRTQLTGPNGLSTAWLYDGFGRLYRETRADGTHSSTAYAWCNDSCPELEDGRQLSYKKTSKSTGSAGAISYFDAVNRVLLVEREGFRGR